MTYARKGSRMFPFITKTWSPIAGGCEVDRSDVDKEEIWACPYRCSYCWARRLINKFKNDNLSKKYSGPFRLHEKAIKQTFKPDDFIFVQAMGDIGAPGIPREIIVKVLQTIRAREDKGTRFLLLTKNPDFYRQWCWHISVETMLGATIETDQSISHEISLAPDVGDRLEAMRWVRDHMGNETFICVEPIMPFSEVFGLAILQLKPKMMAIGYDNYKNGLPEPLLESTQLLANMLEAKGIDVYRKTMREAWDR